VGHESGEFRVLNVVGGEFGGKDGAFEGLEKARQTKKNREKCPRFVSIGHYGKSPLRIDCLQPRSKVII